VTLEDPQGIALRLGLSPEAASSLERRGLLRRLDLDDAEIRERLWRGHLAFDQREMPGEPATKAE
jgi:hypothetical protein